MPIAFVGSESDAVELSSLVDHALGLPKRAEPIGGGLHADSPETWDGSGDPPPGWTDRHSDIYLAEGDPPEVRAAYLLDDETLERVLASPALSDEERERINVLTATRVDVQLDGRLVRPRDHTPSSSKQ